MGIIDNKTMYNLHYADHQMIIAQDHEETRQIVRKLAKNNKK